MIMKNGFNNVSFYIRFLPGWKYTAGTYQHVYVNFLKNCGSLIIFWLILNLL